MFPKVSRNLLRISPEGVPAMLCRLRSHDSLAGMRKFSDFFFCSMGPFTDL